VSPPDYDTVIYTDVDGYWLWLSPAGVDPLAPDADLKAVLLCTTGTASSTVHRRALCSTTIPGGCASLDLKAAVKVRIEIQNVSGDPEIKAFIGPWGGRAEQQLFASGLPGSVTADATDVTVTSAGTVTDASATYQLTGQGTTAFGGYMDRIEQFGSSGPNDLMVEEGLASFTHRDLSGSALLVRDEFARVGVSFNESPNSSPVLTIQNRFGFQSPSLECDWPWGNNANTNHFGGVVERRVDPNEANATLYDPTPYWILDPEPSAPSAVATVYNRTEMFSFRPADFANSQHREITFRPGSHNTANPNYTGASQVVGIALFGDASLGFLNTAIVGELIVTTNAAGEHITTTARIGLWTAFEVGAQPTISTILSQSLTGSIDFFDGSDHTLEFDCHLIAQASGTDAQLVYQLSLDGVAVTWVEANISAGKSITILTTDEAIDFDPPKNSGSTEAFYFYSGTPETDTGGTALWEPWRFHTWAQLTLTGSGSIAADNMASIALASEGSASGQDLHDVMTEEFSIIEETADLRSIHRFDSGHTAGFPHWHSDDVDFVGRRSYRAGCRSLNETEADAIWTFWDAHTGITTPFTWTQDGGSQLTVAFVEDSFELVQVAPGVYACEFELREVFV